MTTMLTTVATPGMARSKRAKAARESELFADFAPREVGIRPIEVDIDFPAGRSLHVLQACRVTYVCTEDSIYCCVSC